ncbi:MAG: hypothetical protein ACKPKO_02670, partial [Candidatus Fonsibacter sp.]
GPASTRRVRHARLTILGFKDVGARSLDNHAGASQRYGQTMFGSVAFHISQDMYMTDIAKIFCSA